jgi:GrpB-like predicted nucleotidyltransferase (UPF0157 family)
VRHDATIELAHHDPAWASSFEREARRIRQLLGDGAVVVEHTGSTSVPGLAAKPIIDITLGVPDSADEDAYVPTMEAAGYVLRIREPDWFEHRLFKGPDTDINLHVFTAGSPEIDRMLAFRDHLRADEADRLLYERTKRQLATRTWAYVQDYADAKSAVVADIMTRAMPGDRPMGTFPARIGAGSATGVTAGGMCRTTSYDVQPVCSQTDRSVRPCPAGRRSVPARAQPPVRSSSCPSPRKTPSCSRARSWSRFRTPCSAWSSTTATRSWRTSPVGCG